MSSSSSKPMARAVRNVDLFALTNAVLFVAMLMFVYYERFLRYRGRGNVHEFFIYAAIITALIALGWRYLRRFEFPTPLLVAVQAGILLHFAGAFVPVNGGRLYDVMLGPVRYDKIVHYTNALAAAAVVSRILALLRAELPLIRGAVICLTVLGLGALVEILEYLVLLTIPGAGVGGYENNMHDLIANAAGAMSFLLAAAVFRGRLAAAAARTSA